MLSLYVYTPFDNPHLSELIFVELLQVLDVCLSLVACPVEHPSVLLHLQ